jgi:hypothetical protein
MTFSKYRQSLKLKPVGTIVIPFKDIKCQYNPNLNWAWKRICGESLNINTSPFYHYLCYNDFDKYQDLFRLYGRNNLWITNNILKFQRLYEDIHENGIKELPVVLTKPIVKNKFNSGIEIWEGTRRLSIAQYLELDQKVILCEIVNQPEWSGWVIDDTFTK